MIRLREYQLTSEGRGSVAKSIIRRLINYFAGLSSLSFKVNVFKLGLLYKLEMTSGIKVANNLLGPLPEKIVRFRYQSVTRSNLLRGRKKGKNKILKIVIYSCK